MKAPFTLTLALALMGCGGPIHSNQDGEDDIADATPDTVIDSSDDSTDDTATDPVEDSSEDPELDPAEDSTPDSEPDTSEDTATDTGPDLPPGCVMPTIPDDGLYIWYCMELDVTAMLRFYREVEYSDGSSEPYSEIYECMVNPAARDMLCHLPDYGSDAQVRFNIMTTGVGDAWACASWDASDPWSGATNGVPMVKYMGSWITMNDPVQHSVMATRCFFNFDIP